MAAALNLYTVRDGNKWLNEDGQYTEDQAQAKAMPYEVAEAHIHATWRGENEHRWIEPKGFVPRKSWRVKWLEFQINFLESFREPSDSTNFPGWITKQVRKRQAKIEQLKR